MIIAGEASGDMRAAGLARALKELDPYPAAYRHRRRPICARQVLNVLRISPNLR